MLVDIDAPGFRLIERDNGESDVYWYAAKRAIDAGYLPRTVRLFGNLNDMQDVERLFNRCHTLWNEMLEWLNKGAKDRRPIYDGTLGSLIDCYLTDKESVYFERRFSVQELYANRCAKLKQVAGARSIAKLKGTDVRTWYRELRKPAKPAHQPRERLASGSIEMLRIVVNYGCELGLKDCIALGLILDRMTFRPPTAETGTIQRKRRKVPMTFEYAEAIVNKGIEIATPTSRAVAIGVAAQFEFTLRQIDVIGYWMPARRVMVVDGMISRGRKIWQPGMRFEDCESGVLDLITLKNSIDALFPVSEYPLFQRALAAIPEADRHGPLVAEVPGQPVAKRRYHDIYCEIREAAGVPDVVWNARARHGGVSEGVAAGAELVDVSKHAQHADITTTARDYTIADVETARRVIRKRVEHRAKSKGAA